MVKQTKRKAESLKTINLALQGGGSHGAFTWGVLDKILEDGRIAIDGICATSAGTMNACAMAYGMYIGGPEKAREILHKFWQDVSYDGQKFNPSIKMPWEDFIPGDNDNSIMNFMSDSLTRMFSPYQLNPFDYNPLRDILEKSIDFEVLRECDCMKLFISATHVRTGKVKVFNTNEITLDVVMASACLPQVFKAVEIDGEDYWDGGYIGNPTLFPLFYETETRDVVIVHINPIERPDTPKNAPDIMNRINEISFNSSLLKELRSIAFVKKLLENDMLKDQYKGHFKDVLVHSISADKAVLDLDVGSKMNTEWSFLTDMRDKGRASIGAWLDKHFDDIGQRDTVDLDKEFLSSTSKIFAKRKNAA